MKFDTEKSTVTEIGTTINKGQDIAWTQDGKIITSDRTKLFFMSTGKKSQKQWIPIEISGGADMLKSVTRIAVNSKGDKIAIVVAE